MNTVKPHDPAHAQYVDPEGRCLWCARLYLETELERTKLQNGVLKEEILNAIPYLKAAQLHNPTDAKQDMIRRLKELTATEKRKCECGSPNSQAGVCVDCGLPV